MNEQMKDQLARWKHIANEELTATSTVLLEAINLIETIWPAVENANRQEDEEGINIPAEDQMPDTVLLEAHKIIFGDRRTDYGGAEESFNRIWHGWIPIMESDIPGPEKVAMAMVWLKVCRYLNGRQHDSLVDAAGYIGCIDQIRKGSG